ncbi:TadE/TadG family type IV pilus assembly protein [Novosphingobium sp.]|uniref:TadE/TadG family type IV pilus assembly protein n=1 Tax=Novosphingobium sp. TaxID=1874826 RepID=UPI0025EC5A51|nr:TadE/TadG family type IV pilus assembly protein [Novosphingobium sp.]
MKTLRTFLRDTTGGGAAEFSLVLPLMVLFLFGIIDAGRFAWDMNQVAKAVQVGARRAVVTDTIPAGLRTYSFAVSGGITQGTIVPSGSFPGIFCTGTSSATTCTWKGGTAPSGFALAPTNSTRPFQDLVERMQQIDPDISYANVRVDYDYSGIGFSGDPNGPDVAPLTKVTVQNLQFRPLTTFIFPAAGITFPNISYSLTMEDGSGSVSS